MNKTGRMIVGVFAAVFAIVLFVLAMKTFDKDIDAVYEMEAEYEVYGGDAYTGIQNAAVDSANASATAARRIGMLLNAVTYIGGSLLLMGSFAFIVVALSFLAKHEDEENLKENKPYQPMYGNAAQKMASNQTTPASADSWKCTCGKVNPKYIVTCSCGKSAREVREQKNTQHSKCPRCGKEVCVSAGAKSGHCVDCVITFAIE